MDMTETRKSKRLQLLERGITKEVRMNESVNYLDYANSPLMWAAAALAVAVVVFQSIRDIIHWPVRSNPGHHDIPAGYHGCAGGVDASVIYRFC